MKWTDKVKNDARKLDKDSVDVKLMYINKGIRGLGWEYLKRGQPEL